MRTRHLTLGNAEFNGEEWVLRDTLVGLAVLPVGTIVPVGGSTHPKDLAKVRMIDFTHRVVWLTPLELTAE